MACLSQQPELTEAVSKSRSSRDGFTDVTTRSVCFILGHGGPVGKEVTPPSVVSEKHLPFLGMTDLLPKHPITQEPF